MGRPLRFKNPSQMEKEIKEFFSQCQEKLEIPLISWMEHKLGFRFRDYEKREAFSYVLEWAKEESEAICEQLAFQGRMSKVAARLYLSCKRGYVVEKKIELNHNNNVSIEPFKELLDSVSKLPEESQEEFDQTLKEAVEYDESEGL